MAKVQHKEFKLATVAGRVGLLTGLTAGTVSRAEVEQAVVNDTEKRPHRKPVVVPISKKEVRFPSVRTAAHSKLTDVQPGLTYGPSYLRKLNAMEKRIANYCNADNVKGYYWSE